MGDYPAPEGLRAAVTNMLGTRGVYVDWRSDGHQMQPEDSVAMLCFEVSDLNQVIKSAAASPAFVPLLETCGLTSPPLPLDSVAL